MTVLAPPTSAAQPSAPSTAARSRSACHPRRATRGLLGCYADPRGRSREIVALPARAGSVLVVDRDAHTLRDRRLLAHLSADEPAENASLVCRLYLLDRRRRRPRCRALLLEDLRAPDPFHAAPGATPEHMASVAEPSHTACTSDSSPGLSAPRSSCDCSSQDSHTRAGDGDGDAHSLLACDDATHTLLDRHGRPYRLGFSTSRLSIPELRWLRLDPGDRSLGCDDQAGPTQPVSFRDVVGCLESYEPARSQTIAALERHRDDSAVSVSMLRGELRRLDASRIVLNRALRNAVLHAIERDDLSLSEIAARCGRVKRDGRGHASGETTWLARRVGISPDASETDPTPWIHSDVLALIARSGLGISPHEVELG